MPNFFPSFRYVNSEQCALVGIMVRCVSGACIHCTDCMHVAIFVLFISVAGEQQKHFWAHRAPLALVHLPHPQKARGIVKVCAMKRLHVIASCRFDYDERCTVSLCCHCLGHNLFQPVIISCIEIHRFGWKITKSLQNAVYTEIMQGLLTPQFGTLRTTRSLWTIFLIIMCTKTTSVYSSHHRWRLTNKQICRWNVLAR